MKNPVSSTYYDVAVIGGGPAGMMAAGTAAARGLRVILIEKNETLGKKLLITGGGRCNVTNATFDIRTILTRYAEAEPFLYSTFSQHDVQATLDFFNSRNMPTTIEKERRVFPSSNQAQSVWDVLVHYMREGNVTVLSNSPVTDIVEHNGNITKVIVKASAKNGNISEVSANSFILATGGVSRPETGSTGDGFTWLKKLGHTIHAPIASLVPLITKEEWVHKLHGITLPDVALSLFQNNERQPLSGVSASKNKKSRGKLLFTHVGVSGPTILNMSSDAAELLGYEGDVELSIDLLPDHDTGTLNTALQELFKTHHTKKIKNSLGELIPNAIVEAVLDAAHIKHDTMTNSVTREERIQLVNTLKDLRTTITDLYEKKAVVSSGGLELSEVDFKTMQSRKYPNLYIVGDVLNINRPSGGYSLQICWTTGFVAGNSVGISK
ncbi:MAG: NAD(P)/FAD-dependent oxidoreductase [Candidatus Taylorbacteria bacterium]|nr:NAD(P)/FAD-dependent oxidoreductase [Candidatus Taylorbacteria bacterium]